MVVDEDNKLEVSSLRIILRSDGGLVLCYKKRSMDDIVLGYTLSTVYLIKLYVNESNEMFFHLNPLNDMGIIQYNYSLFGWICLLLSFDS